MVSRGEGFGYSVSRDQINRYKLWPIERRLKWLFYGNKLRKDLPSKTIKIQEAFRQGTDPVDPTDPTDQKGKDGGL